MIRKGDSVCFVTPPVGEKAVIRDYAAGLGFEANSEYVLPPLDNLQLASCIQHDFKISVIDAQAERINTQEVIFRLKSDDVKLVVCEFAIPTLNDDLHFVEQISDSGIIVVGKIYTQGQSILEQIFSSKKVLLCLVSECEFNLREILLGSNESGTARLEDGLIRVYPQSFVQNLDQLPFSRRDLVRQNTYHYPKLGECTTLLSSRGCPYSCRYYCPYPLVQGKIWRARSSSSVLKELAEIKELGIYKVLFRDPVFSFSQKRVEEICLGTQKLELEWWCETRADLLPSELLELMARSGCKGINIGVESGDPDLRFDKLKRGVSDEILFRVSHKAREVGIKLVFLMMVGFPGETRKSIFNTARLIQQCRPYSVGVSFPVNHPGTELERDALRNNWIRKDYQFTDGSVPVLIGPGLNQEEMIDSRNFILALFEAIEAGKSKTESQIIEKIQKWQEGE